MANYRRAGTDPNDSTALYTERTVDKPSESLETNYGHVVATQGMHILESTTKSGDIIVVHPSDLGNANIWTQV